jgi:hypothetical protein
MRYELILCDICGTNQVPADAQAMGWVEIGDEDVCPKCADEQAVASEHDLAT